MKPAVTAWILPGSMVLWGCAACAGGIERTTQSLAVLFEPGGYAEFSLGALSPDISGVGAGSVPSAVTPSPGLSSGDMTGHATSVGAAVKQSLGRGWDAALVLDQPFGAEVDYATGSGYFAAGSVADLTSAALTVAARYRTAQNVSLIGGLRYQTLEASAKVPFVSGYTGTGARDAGFGYVLGLAWERPDIALRVALTYNSRIRHHLDSTEQIIVAGIGQVPRNSDTVVDTPQSVNLEFQTGIAPKTLLFGSVRWVEWSNFAITPQLYRTATQGGSLVSYDHDTITYTLGVGRQFTPVWAGSVSASYESADGGFASNLGPNDGFWTLGVGGSYTSGKVKVSAGVRYVDIGGADTTLGGGVTAARFSDNSGIAVGVKLAYAY